jgi:hypothetical protein
MSAKNFKEKPDMTREQNEQSEGMTQVKEVNAPKTRFQQDQQIGEAMDAKDTNAGDQDYNKHSAGVKGTSLKQEVASKVLVNGTSGAGSLETAAVGSSAKLAGAKTMTYSGTEGTILGAASGTPNMGKSDRADSRLGRRLDATNKKINYLVSEQVVVEYDQPTPLAESDSTQGYNGTPKNTSARMQKTQGTTPTDLLYDRSIDEITRDEVFFTSGQYVRQQGVALNDSPTKTWDVTTMKEVPFSSRRGSFMPVTLNVTFEKNKNGSAYVSSFSVDEIDVTPNPVPYNVMNLSGTNAIIDMNMAEIDRQGIDTKAGIETNPNWSPLARAVPQPTATVGYLRDMENIVGSEVYTSYRFANKSLAYQLNKAAKDGQNTTGPRNEMLLGLIGAHVNSGDYDPTGIYKDPFDPVMLSRGAPSLLIDLFDSAIKYKNKADILTQPRSLKMHVQTADNNINQFRVKPEFVAALNSRDVFSTIDRGYDAMSPVCMTDCVRLIHPLSFASSFGFTDDGTGRKYTSQLFAYQYKNRMSTYVLKITNPLLAGIAYFMDMYADALYKKCDGHKLCIPIVHSTRCFSLWDFLVCACVPYIQWERTNSMKDVLDYETAFEYPFHQLKDLGSLNPLAATNYTLKSRDEPLEAHEMLPSVALSWILPESFVRLSADKTLLPWYFTEGQFTFGDPTGNDTAATVKAGAKLGPWAGLMNYPVTRAGVRSAYLDDVYSMSERDLRLTLDRMVVNPGYSTSPDDNKLSVYKYSQATEGGVIDYNGAHLTAIDILKTPRELGWFMVAPAGVCQPTRIVKASEYKIEKSGDTYPKLWYKEFEHSKIWDTSYRLRSWCNFYSKEIDSNRASLDPNAVAINRAENFIQKWDERCAVDPAYIVSDFGYATIVASNIAPQYFNAVPIAFNDVCGASGNALSFGNIAWANYETTGTAASNGIGQKYTTAKLTRPDMLFYNRIQKLPFVLNPFDGCTIASCDPFAFASMLNFAGFMESDYNEDCYNRIVQVQNQGWLYSQDPFVHDSPIFKDSFRLTM